jgi:predicted ATPase/DNA-binding XRE family transcriptional regulator
VAAGDERTFAASRRAFRESRSLTQEELAARSGLTVKAIGALERGERRRPFPHTVRALADALGLDDDARQQLVGSVPARARGTTTPSSSALAPPASPLIGREDDVAHVVGLFERGHRVVTLPGPGGVGKTRLALETVARHGAALADRAVVVDVSALRDPTALLPSVAAALAVTEDAGEITAPSLASALAGRRVLVLLDNLEHLLGCSTVLADLVACTPDLRLLVTSRAPLRIRPERELTIEPLALPDDDSPDAVAGSPAVAMFLDRAEAPGAPLASTAENAAVLATICRRLDGLPLALELTAAWVGVLGPTAILDRLDRGLPDAAPRDRPERQRTLAATLDWSHDLLAPDEQALFAQLAVFTDGFSLEAVEAVARTDDVVAGLRSLVEQSLVTRAPAPDDRPRFRLLEPVR